MIKKVLLLLAAFALLASVSSGEKYYNETELQLAMDVAYGAGSAEFMGMVLKEAYANGEIGIVPLYDRIADANRAIRNYNAFLLAAFNETYARERMMPEFAV